MAGVSGLGQLCKFVMGSNVAVRQCSHYVASILAAAARGKAIRDFQTDPPTKVFLLTHRWAGGLI
jgi:hypothetical protein